MKFCKKCGVETIRYTNGGCRPCNLASASSWQKENKEKKAVYDAQYRAENKDRISNNKANYHAANAEEINQKRRMRYAKNPDAEKITMASYYKDNRDKLLKDCASYYVANKIKHAEYGAAWRAANPEKKRLYEINRRARKLSSGGKLSADIEQRLLKLQRGLCPCCKQPLWDDYHIDHIMPLALGGKNEDSNIQLLRAKCNMQKNAKHPINFMQQRGFLI